MRDVQDCKNAGMREISPNFPHDCVTVDTYDRTILGERDAGDCPRVTLEVCDVGAFLQVPDLDDGILRSGAKDQTVRMELGAGEGCEKHDRQGSYSNLNK